MHILIYSLDKGVVTTRTEMGIPTDLWRARIGRCFSGLHRAKPNMAAIKLDKGRPCVHLAMAFLWVFVVLPYTHHTEAVMTMDWMAILNALEPIPMNNATTVCEFHMSPPAFYGGIWVEGTTSHCVYARYSSISLLLSGDIELNPGPEMCIPQCKHKHREASEMIRCCMCAVWFHEECVGITSDAERGVWPCPECRQLTTRVTSLIKTVTNLVNLTEQLKKDVDDLQKKREDDTKMLQEIKASMQGVSSGKATSTAWKSQEPRDDPGTIVIGDSLVKDLNDQKLEDTSVVCQRDARITDVAEKVKDLKPGFKNIVLVAGGHDCDGSDRTAASIVDSYTRVVDEAKKKAESVTVVSIPPRLRSQETSEKIQTVNAGLLAMCGEKGATFANNDPYYVFADGTTNEGYLEADGIHLSRSGLNRLSKTAGLKPKDNVSDVYGNITASGRKGGYRGTSRDAPVTNTVHDTQREPRCYYCYERGHVKNNCRHGRVVRCHSCGRLGHKEKFCGST